MFAQTSMVGTGLIITLVEMVLRHFDISFGEGEVAVAINGLLAFVGFIFILIGQLRRKDLKFGLLRK